jgi:Leucine-rich repeat (LRR) protein
VKHLDLSDGGLSDRATNCVDFKGLSALEELDLSGNKISSLPSGIGFLPKLGRLSVQKCKYLVSILDLPSSLYGLDAYYCKSLERVRIPIESKNTLYIDLSFCYLLEEIQDIEGQSKIFWCIRVDNHGHSPNKLQKSVVKVLFLSVSLAQK